MEKRIFRNKVICSFIVLLLSVSIAIPIVLHHEANAQTNISKIDLVVGDHIEYAGYSTCHVTDKETGYAVICAQPSKQTPKEGTYTKDYNWENNVEDPDYSNCETEEERATVLWLYENRISMIERVFYFGHPDSPGFSKDFWPDKWYDGSSFTKDKFIALTHVVLSDLYANDLETATYGCNSEFKSWLAEKITGGYSKGDGKVTSDSKKNSIYGKMYHSRTNKEWTVPKEFKIYRVSTGNDTQDMFGIEAVGYLCLTKSSANSELTDKNSCYSLEGATYGIFKDKDCKDQVAKIITDKNGYAKSNELNIGEYYIKELVAPSTYTLNSNIIKVKVSCATITSADTSKTKELPKIVDLQLLLQKLDKESSGTYPLGAASLENAEFTLKYYDNTSGNTSRDAIYSWVFKTDKTGAVNFQDPENYLVSGSKLFKASDGTYGLPIGTYTLEETKAPEGYIINKEIYTQIVKASGTTEKINTWNVLNVPNQVKRGDISFNKKNGETGEHMAMTVFKLTSKTTGECHILLTDENGYFSSASNWNAHSNNTNANDTALAYEDENINESELDSYAGIWFGLQANNETYCEVNDELCALPYDKYILEELPCEANNGMNLVKDDNIIISRNNTIINFGTIDNNPQDTPDEDEPEEETPTPQEPETEEPKTDKPKTEEEKVVKKQSPEKQPVILKTDAVKTGEADYLALILILMVSSFAAFCIALIYKKRANKTPNKRPPKN